MKWPLVTLSLVPVSLFAYLGHFSRLIADDYCVIAKSQEAGLWDALHYYYTSWTSSLTRFFLVAVLAPVDTALASITPIALVLIWSIVLVWVFWLAIRRARRCRTPWPLLLMLVFLVVSASINGMHSLQSFYWFIASTAYTLPIPLFVLCIGITLIAARWSVPSGRIIMAAMALGVICFINAGFSEMYLIFQCTVLTGLLVATIIFPETSLRRPYLFLIGAGWFGTIVSALVQLNSPGIAARLESNVYERFNMGAPVRTLPDLFIRSIEETFQYIGHQEAFAGFMLALAAALYVTLCVYRPRITMDSAGQLTFKAPALWVGLIIQLLFVPILWTHMSDSPQVLGRFSFAYFTVVCINVIQIIGFGFLLVLRGKLEDILRNRERWHLYITALLLAALALFALTQVRSIHFSAATFLFTSAFVMLCVAWLQLKSSAVGVPSGRLVWLPLFASCLSLMCYGSLTVLALYAQGFVVERVFAPATFVHVVSGALWGAGLGCLIQHSAIFRRTDVAWVAAYKVAGLIAVFAISIGIVIGQLRMLPRMATFAREWDQRHAEIIRQRDSGNNTIVVPELSYDFGYDLVRWHIFDTNGGRCSAVYYGVDSIIRSDNGG